MVKFRKSLFEGLLPIASGSNKNSSTASSSSSANPSSSTNPSSSANPPSLTTTPSSLIPYLSAIASSSANLSSSPNPYLSSNPSSFTNPSSSTNSIAASSSKANDSGTPERSISPTKMFRSMAKHALPPPNREIDRQAMTYDQIAGTAAETRHHEALDLAPAGPSTRRSARSPKEAPVADKDGPDYWAIAQTKERVSTATKSKSQDVLSASAEALARSEGKWPARTDSRLPVQPTPITSAPAGASSASRTPPAPLPTLHEIASRRNKPNPIRKSTVTFTGSERDCRVRPWQRWECCQCGSETFWGSKTCSWLKCFHARCEECEELAGHVKGM